MKTQMVQPRQALAAMTKILGRDARPHEIYNAVTAGRIRREEVGRRRYLFSISDAEREAREILARSAQTASAQATRPEEPMMTSAQALERITTAGVPCNRSRFFKLGLSPAWEEKRSGNPAFFFLVTDIDALIEKLLAQKDGLMSSKESVDWLNRRYPEANVNLDRFYHWIHRQAVRPTSTIEHGNWSEYRFSEEALLASPVARSAERATEKPVRIITNSSELLELEREYGPLVTAHAAAQRASRDGDTISTGAIKARRQRRTLRPVAKFGNALLFPERSIRGGRTQSSRPTG